jgi:hypothetical protein
MHLDDAGIARTRPGSIKLNAAAPLAGPPREIVEMAGNRYEVAGGNIYMNETLIASGLVDAPTGSLLYKSYTSNNNSVFLADGTDRKRVTGNAVAEWGIDAPTVAPTVGVGAGTDLTGVYYAWYSYVRKEGSSVVCESNPSPQSGSQSLTNQSLAVTCTAPVDPQVTHIRLYRSVAAGNSPYVDQDVALPTVIIDTSTADTALGTGPDWDHYRPPLGGSLVIGPTYNGYCFMAVGNLLYFCRAKMPEYWPQTYYIEVGSPQFPIIGMVFWGGYLYCLTGNEMWMIMGTGYQSFFPVPVKSASGLKSRRGLDGIKGYGVPHLGPEGIYLYTGIDDMKITEKNFGPVFRGLTVGSVPGLDVTQLAQDIIFFHEGKIWFGYCSIGASFPDNWLVTNHVTGKTVHYQFGQQFTVLARDNTNNRLLAGDVNGYVWEINKVSQIDDNGVAIPWQVESKSYADQLYKYFPRYAKYDVSLDDPSTTGVTGNILLDDAIVQSHAITVSRNTSYRLICGCTGDRLGMRITGSGPASVYAAEVE